MRRKAPARSRRSANPATRVADHMPDEAVSAGQVSDEAAVALADAVRRLMDAAVLTELDDSARTAVATDIDALTATLQQQSRAAMPWPDPESMRRGHRPYSPVIGAANPIAPP